jgi:hypothetical protein
VKPLRLPADQAYSAANPRGTGADGGCDVGGSGEAEQADREVAEAGHRLCGGALADLGTVLVECDVAHPVNFVLDAPVAAVQCQEAGRGSLVWRQAGDANDGLVAEWTAIQVLDDSFDAEDLASMGEFDVPGEFNARPDPPLLDPSVTFIKRGALGGKGPLGPGLRCPSVGWVGCP